MHEEIERVWDGTVMLFSIVATVLTLIVPASVDAVVLLDESPSESIATLSSQVMIIIILLIFLILLIFFWNLGKFILSKEEDKKAQAKDHLLWSVVGVAVLSTLWSAAAFLRNVTAGEGLGPDHVRIPS